MALYDGLIFEDRWSELEPRQYEGLHQIFSHLALNRELDDDEVATAIMAIERVGVNTSPYPFFFEEPEDEETPSHGGS